MNAESLPSDGYNVSKDRWIMLDDSSKYITTYLDKHSIKLSSDKSKEFLVDLAKTGRCDSVYLDVIRDHGWRDNKQATIFDDDEKNGLEAKVYFNLRRRDNENNPRLSDNPTVKRFVEKYGLFMK